MTYEKQWPLTFPISYILLCGDSEVKVLVAQSCLTLCDPMDYSPPGSSAHRILQGRILQWVAIFFFRGFFLTQGLNTGLLHCRQILYQEITFIYFSAYFFRFNAINLNQHWPVKILEPHMSVVNVLVETFKKLKFFHLTHYSQNIIFQDVFNVKKKSLHFFHTKLLKSSTQFTFTAHLCLDVRFSLEMFDMCLSSLQIEKGKSHTHVILDTLRSFLITELSLLRSLNFNW